MPYSVAVRASHFTRASESNAVTSSPRIVAGVELVVGPDLAGDLQARVGARNIEEAFTELGADADILYRFGLRHRQIGRVRSADGHQAGNGAEKKRFQS